MLDPEFLSDDFKSPEIPVKNAIVIGSFCLRAYADRYNVMPVHPIKPNDIDLLVDRTSYEQLKTSGWHANTYRGTTTLRDRPNGNHMYDAGTSVYKWSYDEIVDKKYTITHDDVLYLDPLRMLIWKLALNRKKDKPHIEFLATLALPAWLRSDYVSR